MQISTNFAIGTGQHFSVASPSSLGPPAITPSGPDAFPLPQYAGLVPNLACDSPSSSSLQPDGKCLDLKTGPLFGDLNKLPLKRGVSDASVEDSKPKIVRTTEPVPGDGDCGIMMTGDVTSIQLYQLLTPYILTEEELELHGFPRPDPLLPDVAVISSKYRNWCTPKKDRFKQCVRCSIKFELEDDGSYIPKTQCCFHWGKWWKTNVDGGCIMKWSCCGGEATAAGCSTSQAHVHEDNKFEDMTGYRSTMPCPNKHDGDYGVYALDCEMVYTTGGRELARLTVVDHNNKMVLEKLLKPQHTVVDFNTRFSGLNEASLHDVNLKLVDVQTILLNLFNSGTILIGHSLESDLTALKHCGGYVCGIPP